MDSVNDEYQREFEGKPQELLEYLGDHIEQNTRQLDDDENFCNKDIDATVSYIETIEEKFRNKTQELKDKLEEIRRKNAKQSTRDKAQFENEITEVNELFTSGQHREAFIKFKDYERRFAQRTSLINDIPKLHMTEHDVEQFFSENRQTNPPMAQTIVSTIPMQPLLVTEDDGEDESTVSEKQKLRRTKEIESDSMGKDNQEMGSDKHEHDFDRSLFGIRSKRADNSLPTATTTDHAIIKTDDKPPTTTVSERPRVYFSTRLRPSSDTIQLSPSVRNTHPPSSVQNHHITNHDNNEQAARLTPPTSNSAGSSPQQKTTPNQNHLAGHFAMNPVTDYQHEPNSLLLMTCNARYIVLFTSQLNRLDRWRLGAVERGTQNQQKLDWHDGLIISMGLVERNSIYMFTEREFYIYSIQSRRKLLSRVLPHGNDNGSDLNSQPYNDFQRGIGTVYGKHMYHIYLNRNCRWTLSKNLLQDLVHIYDYDLTRIFPDVERFIHFCVNEKTINFLVQMSDFSYGVVFCSTKDCTTIKTSLPIILSNARQPLTICSALLQATNKFVCYINDPSNEALYMTTTEEYLDKYTMNALAICYVAERHELMIVINNSICSVNLK